MIGFYKQRQLADLKRVAFFLSLLIVAFTFLGCIGTEEDYDKNLETFEGCKSIPGHPFGSHHQKYAKGVILPDVSQDEMDAAVISVYDNWKKSYVKSGSPCKKGQYWVATNMGDKSTVSEAHGYGMIIMAYMAGYDKDAKKIFDGMYDYFRAHPSKYSQDLMAWAQDYDCNDTQGVNSATDGDMDIAYGLLLADKQWGSAGDINYRKEARKVIRAIMDHETQNDQYLLLADWAQSSVKHTTATRLSDFMPDHFESFAADDVSGLDGDFLKVRDYTYGIISKVSNGKTGLVPDFVIDASSDPVAAPPGFLEGDHDGMYGYNSCRVPWRTGLNYVISGNSDAKDVVEPLIKWAEDETGGDPLQFMAGYDLDGTAYAEYETRAFTAPLAVAAMVDSKYQDFLNAFWDHISVPELEWPGYYSDTLQMLSVLVVSNNWWAPKDAVCEDN
ncbi:MAG: hypothetical protein JXR91_00175 [Deltaproteobacteria bacterium]|nr:hypothetical protein [Deltaproteobacteria bacterium]